MFYFKFLLFFTFFNLCAWADKELNLKCGNAKCTEVIGDCEVPGPYPNPDSESKLSLKRGDKLEIYGRDEKQKVYLGKVKGKEKIGIVAKNWCPRLSERKKLDDLIPGSWANTDKIQEVTDSGESSTNNDTVKVDPTLTDAGFNLTNNATISDTSTNESHTQSQNGLPTVQTNELTAKVPKNEEIDFKNKNNPQNGNKESEDDSKRTSNMGSNKTEDGDSGEDGVTVENASSSEDDATPPSLPQSSDGNPNEGTQKPSDNKLLSDPPPTHPPFYAMNRHVKLSEGMPAINNLPKNLFEEKKDTTGSPSATGQEHQANNVAESTNNTMPTDVGLNGNMTTGGDTIKNDSQTMDQKEQSSKTSSPPLADENPKSIGNSSPPSNNENQESSVTSSTPSPYESQGSNGTASWTSSFSASAAHDNEGSGVTASTPPLPQEKQGNFVASSLPHKNLTPASPASSDGSSVIASTSPSAQTQASSTLSDGSSVTGSPPSADRNLAQPDIALPPLSYNGNQASQPAYGAEPINSETNTENKYSGLSGSASIPHNAGLDENVTSQSQTNEREDEKSGLNASFNDYTTPISSDESIGQKLNIEQTPNNPNLENSVDPKTSEMESTTFTTLSDDPIDPKQSESISYQPNEAPVFNDMNSKEAKPSNLPSDSTESTNEQNENYSQEIDMNDTTDEPSESWYSSILSYMPAFDSLLINSPNTYSYEKPSEVYQEIPQASESFSDNYESEHIHKYLDDEESCPVDNSWISVKTTSWLVFTSVVILVFSLGYYYMENSKRDLELVIKNNDLASELFILQKERSVLEERLLDAEYNANLKSGEVQKEVVESLQNEIDQIKDEKLKLVEREQSLVKKCAMLEANYAKLRQMFAENKQKGERSALIADIKKLKESSSSEIASLKEQLDVKAEEIKTLSVNLHKSNEAKVKLEDKLNTMMADEQKAIKNYQDSVAKLEQMIEESKGTVMKLEDEVGKLKKDCESLKIEKELAETALQKAHGLKSSESLSSWLDSKEIRISLASAENEIKELKQIKEDLERKQDSSLSKFEQLHNELQDLNEKYEKAEKDKIEALTKLQVLSDYFNEKETQLQEELGLKEALWLQKQSDDHTIYEQMRTLREENQTFKSQNETLRKEIIDQETSYKKLIASAEEKADGYWVSLRQAERRLKETQIEASQLRNRLTAIETSEHNLTDDKMMKGIENGEMPPFGPTTSPPFMMYPGEFIPPPPLIPVTPSRPPPLGRISSPPLGDFTPPLPIPFDLYPPSPPPPLQHLHRPQPREPTRKQKESQSSNHSSESTSEKPQRRTKR